MHSNEIYTKISFVSLSFCFWILINKKKCYFHKLLKVWNKVNKVKLLLFKKKTNNSCNLIYLIDGGLLLIFSGLEDKNAACESV